MNGDARAALIGQLRAVLGALERGDDGAVDIGMVELVKTRDDSLFARVARLTRELHQAVVELRMDERLASLAGDEIPDARNRLDYVMKVTERAAHTTLDLVDQARTVTSAMERATERLQTAADEAGSTLVGEVVQTLQTQNALLRRTLSELSQAQEYQDISGQIIRRVITLVRNVETALLELLRAAGPGLQSEPRAPIQALSTELPGPAVPGGAPAASQQDADDLLASLGF